MSNKFLLNGTDEILSKSEVISRNKNVSFPKEWNESVYDSLNITPILPGNKPATGKYQDLVENGTIAKDGSLFENWTVVDWSEEKIAAYEEMLSTTQAASVRSARDNLLADSDWVVTKALEVGEAVPEAWATYRQALRDITSLDSFPDLEEEEWPVKPA
jgi:hypothetical protein